MMASWSVMVDPCGGGAAAGRHKRRASSQPRLRHSHPTTTASLSPGSAGLRQPGASGRAHLFSLLLLLGCLAVLGDKRPLFQEPSTARLRFLKGKRLPHVCKNPASFSENPNLEFSDLVQYPQKVLQKADPELTDASSLLTALSENVGNDVILTRDNFANAWVRKLPLTIYNWEQGSLPPNLSIALGGKTKFKSCALVGSSGHLGRTSYGTIIDKFDAVARANQAPTKGYEIRAGSKTTIRFMNEAVGRQYRDATRRTAGIAAGICKTTGGITEDGQYMDGIGTVTRISLGQSGRRLASNEDPSQNLTGRVRRVKNVNRVSRLCPVGLDKMLREARLSKNHVRSGRWDFPMEEGVMMAQVSEQKTVPKSFMELQHNIRLLRPDVKLFMVPNTMTHMSFHVMDNWADRMVCANQLKHKGGARPTTGFQMAMVMLRLCNRVVMYGFGPSARGQRDSAYHFFQGHGAKTWQTSSDKVHNFRAEYMFFKSLQSKGLITICNDGTPADCGISDIKMGEEMGTEEVQAPAAEPPTEAPQGPESQHPGELPMSRQTRKTRRGWLGVGRRSSIVRQTNPAGERGDRKPQINLSIGSFLKAKAAVDLEDGDEEEVF